MTSADADAPDPRAKLAASLRKKGIDEDAIAERYSDLLERTATSEPRVHRATLRDVTVIMGMAPTASAAEPTSMDPAVAVAQLQRAAAAIDAMNEVGVDDDVPEDESEVTSEVDHG